MLPYCIALHSLYRYHLYCHTPSNQSLSHLLLTNHFIPSSFLLLLFLLHSSNYAYTSCFLKQL